MSELATTGDGSDAIQIARHIGQIQTLGQTLVKSGLLPQAVRTPEAAVAIILKGRELGIPPMQALSHIHVISGKPTLSAELMLAMVMKAGHEVWIVATNAQRCEIAGKRKGSTREQSLTFSMEDAQRAGVLNNPTWKKYPDAMLRARAISAFCRMFAPDVLMGASYTPEELGADVDESGEVITVEASPAKRRAALEPEVVEEPPEQPPSIDPDVAFPEEPEQPAAFKDELITGGDVKKIAAAMKPLKLDPDTARAVVESAIGREIPGGIKSLTRKEGAMLAEYDSDRWAATADLLRSPVPDEFPPEPDSPLFDEVEA